MTATFVRDLEPVEVTLGSALTRLVRGNDVRTITVYTPSDLYLVLSATATDGDAVPASARMLIPAGSTYAIPFSGSRRPLLAAVAGSAVVTLIGSRIDAARAGPTGGGGGGASLGVILGLRNRISN